MRVMSMSTIKDSFAFAKKAAEHFKADNSQYTFAEGDPTQGGLLAIRWNPYTVLVVKLDESFEPECWPTHDLIQDEFPQTKLVTLDQIKLK